MKTEIQLNNKCYQIDLSLPYDISIPLQADTNNPTAWYVNPPEFTPVVGDGFVGDVNLECLKKFFFLAQLVTIEPKLINGDRVITKQQIEAVLADNNAEAIVIRTTPNTVEKCSYQYSNTNPPYIEDQAMTVLTKNGIDHLLIDTPSVDREVDDGLLKAHRAFWEYPEHPKTHRTITELIYVDNSILDGLYFLNLQIASFENDASPSKPLLFKIH